LARKKNGGFGGDKPSNNGDNQYYPCLSKPHWEQRRACITHPRIADGRDCRLHGNAAMARAGAVVGFARTSRFRGMYRYRGEGGHQGNQNRGRLSECNAKFAGRASWAAAIAISIFMQNRKFDIAGPNPTPERAEAYRRAVHRLSRQSATKQHRGGVSGEAATVAPGLAEDRR